MLFHSKVYAVADKYNIPSLGSLARVNFVAYLWSILERARTCGGC